MAQNNSFFAVVQSLSLVQLFATPWIAVHQASLPFTISWSLLKFLSIEPVMLTIALFSYNFSRLEIQYASHWAKMEGLAGLCPFWRFWGRILSLPSSAPGGHLHSLACGYFPSCFTGSNTKQL